MRAINFNAGPAGLPLPALERAAKELVDYQGTGMSIMEHSHRGKDYDAVHHEAIALLTELLGIPDSHQVLFLQGGASLQFAMVPMNFLEPGASADYIVTGGWSEKALAEAKLIGSPRVAATTVTEQKTYTRIPDPSELRLDPNARYVHLTSNNTLFGTQWMRYPDVGNVPLVADMSSDFLWRPTDVSKFALIYAGAQKNIGPSGLVVVVANKEFIAKGRKDIPKILRYSTHAEADSLYNTPPTFAIYLARNVLAWIKAEGGLSAMEKRNREKGEILYSAIDRMKDFYRCPVEVGSRSFMNIVFRLPSEALEEKFVAEAKQQGMVGLKGHRSVGGIRVSAYNAVSVQDIRTLVSFMESFARSNG
ncbi:MAG: 3-phosphoserine/phosphohydroxythreonine transaminase [Myxococcaceae bacterium]|nr:3-phosphoserine/phosphohydroxythreonine transaminase [Myxococcaceae bacterium]